MHKFSYEDRLEKLKLPSIEFRQIRGDMLQVFKVAKKYYDSRSTESLFNFSSDNRLCGHNYKINKQVTNKSKFQNFFSNRVVNKWNSLPQEVVDAKSINEFKNKFDNLNKDIQFSININYFD